MGRTPPPSPCAPVSIVASRRTKNACLKTGAGRWPNRERLDFQRGLPEDSSNSPSTGQAILYGDHISIVRPEAQRRLQGRSVQRYGA